MMDEAEVRISRARNILRSTEDSNLDHDIDDYADSRIELKATGHNLTSVLMNPRETMFEEFIDEYEIEQAVPLEFVGYIAGEESLDTTVSNYFKDPSCLYNKYKMRSIVGTEHLAKISRLPANAELLYCFQNVPDTYFRSDFFAKHTEIVHAIVAFEDRENVESAHEEVGSASATVPAQDDHLSDNDDDSGSIRQIAGNGIKLGNDRHKKSKSGRETPKKNGADVSVSGVVLSSATASHDMPGNNRLCTSSTPLTPSKNHSSPLSETSLTNYLDLVEVALLRQIMSKSTSFFRALDDIHQLQSMVSRAATRIIHLRRELRGFDNDVVAGPLRIPRLEQRRKNEVKLQEKLLLMQRVMQGRRTVRTLLDMDDYIGAMEVISITRKVYQKHLLGIASMVSIGSQLEAYDDHIIDVMCDRFVNMAISWTETTADHADPSVSLKAVTEDVEYDGSGERSGGDGGAAVGLQALQSEYTTLRHRNKRPDHSHSCRTNDNGGGDNSAEGYAVSKNLTGALQEPLGQLLHALLHVHKLRPALELYSSRLQDSVKLIVRTCLLEYINPNPLDVYASPDNADNTAASGPFAQRVRNMTNENFLACLSMCFESLYQALSRASSIHIFINDALFDEDISSDGDKEDVRSDQNGRGTGNHECVVADHGYRISTNSKDDMKEYAVNGQLQDDPSSGPCEGRLELAQTEGEKSRTRTSSSEDECAMALRESDKRWALEYSSTLLTNTCELAQKSINQLLIMRKETNARLQVDQMKFLWEISLHFVTGIERLEAVPGEKISTTSLRQGLLSQTKKFLEHTHETYKGRLVNTLDNEKWVQCDVSRDRQLALDKLTSGRLFLKASSGGGSSSRGAGNGRTSHGGNKGTTIGTADLVISRDPNTSPTELAAVSNSASATAGNTGDSVHSTTSVASVSAGSGSVKKSKEVACVIVDGIEYKVVWSALFLVEVILTYLDVAVQFPLITKDVISKTVEVTTLFDSRSKQLVLGAQAIESAARLKFIAAKHLGIMAQCLTFFQAVLPHVRAALMAQLPPEHQLMLVELDRVSKGIIEHHAKVLSKFVSIVGDFVDSSSLKLRQIDWDRLVSQCEYFEDVLKNVNALHKVLSNFLPPDQMHDVFSRIFSLLNRKIPEHFEEIFPSTQTGKQRIMDEIVHLVTSLSRLKHVDASVLTVEETFRKKFERK